MKIYFVLLAILNFVFVLTMTYFLQWFVYFATFTAINLLVYGISSQRPLRSVGSVLNFLGVVIGGLAGITPVVYMAVFGGFLLFVDHVSSFSSDKKTSADT